MEQLLEMEDPKQQVEAPAESNAPAPMSKEAFEAKCFAEMGALLAEAKRSELARPFVWVATWHLAVIAHSFGNRATADILQQLATHMDQIADIEAARREADEAKAAGRLPQ